jgi:phospholipase C
VTQAQSTGLANRPSTSAPPSRARPTPAGPEPVTRDLYHRFFENQMQIDGGKNDQFVAWADAGAW